MSTEIVMIRIEGSRGTCILNVLQKLCKVLKHHISDKLDEMHNDWYSGLTVHQDD